jgi:hypothetical protein
VNYVTFYKNYVTTIQRNSAKFAPQCLIKSW